MLLPNAHASLRGHTSNIVAPKQPYYRTQKTCGLIIFTKLY